MRTEENRARKERTLRLPDEWQPHLIKCALKEISLEKEIAAPFRVRSTRIAAKTRRLTFVLTDSVRSKPAAAANSRICVSSQAKRGSIGKKMKVT